MPWIEETERTVAPESTGKGAAGLRLFTLPTHRRNEAHTEQDREGRVLFLPARGLA